MSFNPFGNYPFVFLRVVVKDVRQIQRAGKTPLLFVDLVDPISYDSTGDYMYMPESQSEMCPPRGTVVDAKMRPGLYNGKANFTIVSLLPCENQTVKS